MKNKIRVSYYIIALGGFFMGYLTTVIAGVLPFMTKEFSLNPSMEGLVSSIVLFGGIFGALSCGSLANKVGRKKAFFYLSIIVTVGLLGSSLVSNINVILFFRFIMGFAIGGFTGIVPMYLSELSPSSSRGKITALNSIFCSSGILLAYVINNLLLSSGNWRLMNLFALIACAVALVGSLVIPESPQWLLSQKKYEDARKISLIISGREDNLSEKERKAIEQSEESEPVKHKIEKWMTHPIMLCVYIVAFQKLTGANAVLFYAPKILESAGIPSNLAFLSTIGIGLIMFIFTFVCQSLIDKKGRKYLLLFGNVAMGLILLALGILTKMENSSSILLVALVFLYIASYALSWGAVPWVLLGEMLPMSAKGIGVSLATGATWLMDSIITLVFPNLLISLGIDNIFVIFGVLNIISYFIVKRFAFETKGKTQMEIEHIERQKWDVAKSV